MQSHFTAFVAIILSTMSFGLLAGCATSNEPNDYMYSTAMPAAPSASEAAQNHAGKMLSPVIGQ